MKYFTSIRNDVLENSKLSLGAKGLYCLICFDVTTSLRQLLLDPNTKAETIKFANELMENDYAHFFGLEECVSKDSYLGLSISMQPTDEYKKVVGRLQKIRRIRKIKGGVI